MTIVSHETPSEDNSTVAYLDRVLERLDQAQITLLRSTNDPVAKVATGAHLVYPMVLALVVRDLFKQGPGLLRALKEV